jgi:hypothetical protein
MTVEEKIRAGVSVEAALQAFREGVNRPDTIFSTDHWLLPKLEQLKTLLSDPITEGEATALLDVLHQRHWIADLLEWIETRPVAWTEFFEYRKMARQEQALMRAEERKRRRTAELGSDRNEKIFPDEFYVQISDVCPDCGSADWRPVAYGLPSEDMMADAELGEIVLGGCMVEEASRFCRACFNKWPSQPDESKPLVDPQYIAREIAESRSIYSSLSELAALPPDPDEPTVEHAWACIDGTVHFLISTGEKRARVIKRVEDARIGGAPTCDSSMLWMANITRESLLRMRTLAEIAAVRFERVAQIFG